MKLDIKFNLTQIERLEKLLHSLPRKLQRKILREETRRATNTHMLQQARALAPVATGSLRKAIKTVAIKRSRKFVGVRLALSSAKLAKKVIRLGRGKKLEKPISVFYGGFMEYGFRLGARSQSMVAAQMLQSRRRRKATTGIKKDGTKRSRSALAEKRAAVALSGDKRRKIEGRWFLRETVKQHGQRALDSAVNAVAKRVEAELIRG